jgi:hypothetical protein
MARGVANEIKQDANTCRVYLRRGCMIQTLVMPAYVQQHDVLKVHTPPTRVCGRLQCEEYIEFFLGCRKWEVLHMTGCALMALAYRVFPSDMRKLSQEVMEHNTQK